MSSETTLAVHIRQHTSIVTEVEVGGLGAALGLLPGDRILEVQGWRVRGSADIRRILDSLHGNASLTVQVRRAGRHVILGPVTLAETPVSSPPAAQFTRREPPASEPPPADPRASADGSPSVPVGESLSVFLVTSESIAGHVVTEVKGLVSCVRPVPRRALTAAAGLESAVDSAKQGIRQSARVVGANAVIAVRIANHGEDATASSSLAQPEAIIMTGTAVVVVPAMGPIT